MRTGGSVLWLLVGAVTLSSCGGGAGAGHGSTTSSSTSTTSAAAGSGVSAWGGTPVTDTAIPLGDGNVSTSPQAGSVDSCTTQFGGGGARSSGSWLDSAAGTWNATTKPHVEGSVSWPQASHSFTVSGSTRDLVTDDLPTGATTGTFPISPSDPAHQYDANPNHIAAHSDNWQVPAQPPAAGSPGCLGLGPIGVFVNGVVLFDALDAAGRDAGAHEIQDACGGHPQQSGAYHYHSYSPCLSTSSSDAPGSSTLVGYALDGYGIYLERDARGNLPSNADLDACHGRTSSVSWDGRQTVMYHYDVTIEYPYTLGCFHGTSVAGPGGP